MTVLVLTALPGELDSAHTPDGVRVVYTGVGKINTALATAEALRAAAPRLVVNYGTVGRIDAALSGLVEISHVVQRDMMAMPLAPRGVTPLSADDHILGSGYGSVVCGTGDSFVTAADPWLAENNIGVVDMELFAIARVCAHYGVPWRAFKFITDGADEAAADHWSANVAKGEALFWDVLRQVLARPQ
ncbi:MAG: 5'-methylthioadenosine nucleosidase [Xanthobacteraceae bacterium]